MFPGGHCPDVGLGGFLLQGGMGWNGGNWGWACERLEAVDVVTAQGELLHCNVMQNEGLYWAARGAGPAFPGLVTQFYLQAMPYPRGIRSSGYIYPRSQYRQTFDWVLAIMPKLDRDTEVSAKSHYQHSELCFSIYFTCMKDSHEEARHALQPIQKIRPRGTLAEWFCQEEIMERLYKVQGKANPKNHRSQTDNAFLQNDVSVSAVLEEACLTLPHQKSFAFWSPMYPWSR